MAFDYKKEYKEFYMPKNKPGIVEVPPMNYLAVRGKGDPNADGSEYKESIGLLYAIAFTIKMSKMGSVQCMHIGPYDDEPETISLMHDFMAESGYELDITEKRLHHEIYLSDARKVAAERLKTVIRHPIKKIY